MNEEFSLEKLWEEHKHLFLWIVIAFCVYLLYQKNYQGELPKFFKALPMLGGAAYGLNFLTTLIN